MKQCCEGFSYILLDGQIIPGGDFIHLYDTTPYHILNGHVALKAPCEDDMLLQFKSDWFCSKHAAATLKI